MIESVELESDGRGCWSLERGPRRRGAAVRGVSVAPVYDTSAKPRRWRSLDLGATQVFLPATTQRVAYPEHGAVVAAAP
jgi:hypothetical protein